MRSSADRRLEEFVDLPSDNAFEAAFRFSAGFAFTGAFGDVGAGVGVDACSGDNDGVQRPVELRSPERLRRCRLVSPEDAGMGAAPEKVANAASDRNRPGWDQLIRICARR